MKRFITIAILLLPALLACDKNNEEGSEGATSVVLSRDKVDLRVGETATITATVLPESLGMGVVWSIIDDTYAEVNDGLITAKAEGVTYVIATASDGSKKAACMVSVNPEVRYSVSIRDELGQLVSGIYGYPGMKAILSAYTSDGETHDFTWTVEDDGTGDITEDGILTLGASESTDPAFVYDASSFVKATTEDGYYCRIPIRSSLYKGIRLEDTYQAAGLAILVKENRSYPIAVLYEGASGPGAIPADDINLDLSNTTDFSIQKMAGAYSLVTRPAEFGVTTKLSVSTIGSSEKVEIAEFKNGGAFDAEMTISDFTTLKAFLEACQPGKTIKGNVTADITLTSAEVGELDALYPVADFDGTVEGNHHTISGLVKPLFAMLRGTVSDLTLNSTLNITVAMNNVGIFAQSASNATLTGCISMGSVTSSASSVNDDLALGGLVGSITNCTLTACQNKAAVTNNTTAGGMAYVGGLIGVANGANTLSASGVDKNINSGDVSENSSTANIVIGGLVAYATGEVSDFSNCCNEGEVTVGGAKHSIYIGGVAGGFNNASVLDYASNSGQPVFSSVTMDNSSSYIRLGGVIGGWFNDGCSSQTITGCTNTADITIVSDDLKLENTSGSVADCFAGGIAGGGKNGSVCGKALVNCTNSGAITMGNSGSYNSGKLYHRFCLGGIIGYTDVNPTGSKCIANIRFRSTRGTNRVGGIVGEMRLDVIHDVTYKGTVNSNGTSGTNFTALLVGDVGTGTRTFKNCTVSGTSRGPNSTTVCSGIFFSCNGGGTGPTVNIESCKVGSGTRLQTASSGYTVTITSADQITAANVCGTNGSNRTCTTGTNDGLSIVVDPDTITL